MMNKIIMLIMVMFTMGLIAMAQTANQPTTLFHATPLTDFSVGQKYLNSFEGFLYENNSNQPPADHASDGLAAAARIQPLDANGNPSPSGKIVVVGIGMSNWTMELCLLYPQDGPCNSGSFMGQASANALVNHSTLVLLDCAIPSFTAGTWINDNDGGYTDCLNNELTPAGVTEAQVQVILYKDAEAYPSRSLRPTTVCSATSTIDACDHEELVGETARYLKTRYPNVQQMFLQSRIYAGYATTTLNPEPYAYQYGFSIKWLIEAQIIQIRTGRIDPTAGDLSYKAAPWLAWGAYLWASDGDKRSDGLQWLQSDFASDGTHPSNAGVQKVGDLLMNFFLNSQFTPWFRASSAQRQ
jgi:hypothetical protein